MDIIAFLLKNWYLLFIVYAVIAGIRGSRKMSGGGQSKPKGAMPPFGGGGGPGRSSPKKPSPARTEGGATKGTAVKTASRSAPEEALQPAQASVQDLKLRASSSKKATLSETDTGALEPGEAAADIGRWSDRPAVNGVIWAEVLSAPRSKRPYRK